MARRNPLAENSDFVAREARFRSFRNQSLHHSVVGPGPFCVERLFARLPFGTQTHWSG